MQRSLWRFYLRVKSFGHKKHTHLNRYYIFIFFLMIFSSCRLFCSFRPATFLGKSAFPDSIWVIPQFLLHIFILASCIIFSSKAVQLSDSRLPAEAETPLTLISVSLLFPGCIVCCLPCCSITLIYVLSLLCLSFHTSPYEKPRSPPPSLTSVSSLNLSFPPSRISMQLTLNAFFLLVSTKNLLIEGN